MSLQSQLTWILALKLDKFSLLSKVIHFILHVNLFAEIVLGIDHFS